MKRAMRRIEKQLELSLVEDILKRGEYGTLAMIGEDGYPYSLPISYAYGDDTIYLHSATEGKKLDIIAKNDKVSFSVVVDTRVIPKKFSTEYKSVIAFGKGSIVEGEEKIKGLKLLIEKYSPEFLESGMKYIGNAHHKTNVVAIKVEHMTGKENKERV